MRAALPHARAKPLALVFTEAGPAWANAALHASLPAVLHAFTHICAPTRAARQHGKADDDQKQGPEQIQECRVDQAIVLEQPEKANGDEGEWKDAHGFLQRVEVLAP